MNLITPFDIKIT